MIFNPNHWCPGEVVFGEEMAIRKEFQNKGIGTKILNMLFSQYKNQGYKKFIGIANKDAKALRLYKKLGIKESKENILIEKSLLILEQKNK